MTRIHLIAAVAALCAPLAAEAQMGGNQPRFHYDGDMVIEPERGAISLDWTITAFEPELETVTFLLKASLGEVQFTGPDVRAVAVETPEAFDGFLDAYTIALAPPGRDGVREIAVSYSGILIDAPLPNEINTIDPRKVELTVDSFWMPFDQRFSSPVTAELDVEIAGEWAAVSRQPVERTSDGFRIRQSVPALDIAFTLMTDFVRAGNARYAIYDTRREPGAGLAEASAALDFCSGYLNDLSGSRQGLPAAAITINDRDTGGYSRSTLIALTDIGDESPEALTQFICHELGHYWSRGNAMSVENWLNEGLTDYIAMMGMREAHGEAAFEARIQRYRDQVANSDEPLGPVWTPETTARPAYLVAYRKGPLAFARLETLMGRDAFARLIRTSMQEEVATTPHLLALVEQQAGPGMRQEFEAILAE